jgi:hypothetical protein
MTIFPKEHLMSEASSFPPSEQIEPAASYPEEPRRRDWRVVAMMAGVGVLVVALAAFSIVWFLHPSTALGTNQTHVVPAGPGCTKIPQQVRAMVKEQLALGLHLSTEQVTTKLQAGKSLEALATAQGLTEEQLQTLEINAYQTAMEQQVREGKATQPDADHADAQIRSYTPIVLNGFMTSLYLCSG